MKIRAFLVALLMMASSVFVIANDVTPASAWTASCQFYPPYPQGAHLGGAWCQTNRSGGAFHRVVITCQYILLGIHHTYDVRPNVWTSEVEWSWAYCGHHVQDGPNNNDYLLHVRAEFYPSDQYSGGGSSGSW